MGIRHAYLHPLSKEMAETLIYGNKVILDPEEWNKQAYRLLMQMAAALDATYLGKRWSSADYAVAEWGREHGVIVTAYQLNPDRVVGQECLLLMIPRLNEPDAPEILSAIHGHVLEYEPHLPYLENRYFWLLRYADGMVRCTLTKHDTIAIGMAYQRQKRIHY